MARKHDVKNIGLQIDGIELFIDPNINDSSRGYNGIIIYWSSKIGFGEYRLVRKAGSEEWHGDSECMDRNEDKDFLNELMRLFVEKITIDG